MFDGMTAVDVSSTMGLVAMVLLTLNILMGLLVSVNYNTVKQWPRQRLPVPLYRVHKWNAYLALTVAALHPAILLFSSPAKFRVVDVLLPFGSPGQTLYNVFGAVTFYGFLVVVSTSYLRRRLGHVLWKRIHYVAYLSAAFMYAHGLLIDPNLKGLDPDLIDGEKVLVEVCLLLVVGASVWRWRYGSERVRFARVRG